MNIEELNLFSTNHLLSSLFIHKTIHHLVVLIQYFDLNFLFYLSPPKIYLWVKRDHTGIIDCGVYIHLCIHTYIYVIAHTLLLWLNWCVCVLMCVWLQMFCCVAPLLKLMHSYSERRYS